MIKTQLAVRSAGIMALLLCLLTLFAGAGALWAQWGASAYLAGAMRFCF